MRTMLYFPTWFSAPMALIVVLDLTLGLSILYIHYWHCSLIVTIDHDIMVFYSFSIRYEAVLSTAVTSTLNGFSQEAYLLAI